MSIWKKSEFPSPLPTQTVESRRVRQCQSEAARLMFPTRAEMGVSEEVDDVKGTLAVLLGASQLEKKRFRAERGISNYPHLCPATMGGSR